MQRVQKCHLRRAHGTLMLRKTMKIKITDCIRADNRFAECHRARTQASPMAAPSPAARTSSGPRHPMRVPLPEPLRHHARRVDIHPAEATLARNPALRPGDAARLPHTPRAEARIIPMAASWSVRKISKIVIGLPEPSLAVRRRFGGPR